MHTKRTFLTMALGAFLTALGGATVSAGELDGRWQGTWIDNNTGHTGPLRGRFTETRDGNYRVVFSGRFRKVIPFRYKTTLNVVERDGDRVVFAGESRVMGLWKFSYNAVADGCQFHANYCSRRWQGEFDLSR